MFEVGWTEILVIAIVALIVFPTKDLPRLLRTVGQLVGKARRMAGDMQAQFNQALREAEREADLSDLKNSIQNANPLTDIKKTLDPVRTFGDDLKKSVTAPIPPQAAESAPAPTPTDTPAPTDASLPAAAETPVDGPAPVEVARPAETPPPAGTEKPVEGRAPEASSSDGKEGSAA
ncbi:Sec-independent protein translocase protein TatB [Pleomorphomonas carboxyditropha]|uniref:Sec-independent protein translocase protein TatB n=1 Tax=Pleomorphomonas carboxyditropha TaxID=2023338 RepID=A0A2G9WQ73_9HYPH|nr:Sec-independent protein translocase protein TatB [Pleomorphomonas carboxyditropha]PIO96869.1 twin-arginine translocase subunit TatB [Pleomorphomonas carboxyditropha]